MLAGGESGAPALVPGNPEQSPLWIAVRWSDPDLEMPPKENDRLNERQIESLRNWIAAGAPWPNADRRALLSLEAWDYGAGVQVPTSGGLTSEWSNRRYRPEDLWAFQPVERPRIPWESLEAGIEGHPIDAFIARKLGEKGLTGAEPADAGTLLRRVTYGLTGLPPTPEDAAEFLTDSRPDAYRQRIEKLLDSPHYGEKWGQHWLDVVRYADSDGYANDYERANAWRYRDYVIRSFNEDKPYDQFLIEQIAGDELDPTDPEMLIAAGFLRMGPWEHTGMSVAAETRQLFLDDVTNSVGETFMSLPLRCASCHDHKFDPIPTRDYYQIQAVFAPVQFASRPAPYTSEENVDQFDTGQQRLQR